MINEIKYKKDKINIKANKSINKHEVKIVVTFN